MKATIICIALILATAAHAEEAAPRHRLALMSRITCPAIREAVKVYGEGLAEQWARSHGVSEERIEQARRCLR